MIHYKQCALCDSLFSSKRKGGFSKSKCIGIKQFISTRFCSLECASKNRKILARRNIFTCIDQTCFFEDKNKKVLFDKSDLEKILKKKWYVDSVGYATTSWTSERKPLRMHVFLMGKHKGLEVDHINRDRTDNRRCNMRLVTHQENIKNADCRPYDRK